MAGHTTPLEIGDFMSVIGVRKGGYDAFSEVPGTDKVIMVSTKTRKTRVKVNLKNGKPHVLIKIHYDCEIQEKESVKMTISNPSMIKKIEKEFSKSVVKSIRGFIHKAQAAESDIFGFGEHFRAKIPKYWNQQVRTKKRWEEIFKDNLTFEVKIDTQLHRVGMKAK